MEHIIVGNMGRKGLGDWFANFFWGGTTNLYKNYNEAQQFLEDLVLYIFKGYMFLSTCENIWLHRLVLQQCPVLCCVSFLFFSFGMDASYNGYKNHKIAYASTFVLCNYNVCYFFFFGCPKVTFTQFVLVINYLDEI